MSVYVKATNTAYPISTTTEFVVRTIENSKYGLTLHIMKYGPVVNYRISNYIQIDLTKGRTYSPFKPAGILPLCGRYYPYYHSPSLVFDFVISSDGTVSILPQVTIAKNSPINIDVCFFQKLS